MKNDNTTKPTRTKQEEEKLITDMGEGIYRCYFCDKQVDGEAGDCSTECGVFWGCDDCWPKWGNPDEGILDN